MINAKIIADSKNEFGDRITTMMVTFPRFILAELNTHRMFSRNSASSRAIPFKKMVEMVKTNPFVPIAWQKEHTGMQGTEYFQPDETFTSENPMDRFYHGSSSKDSPTKIVVDRLKAEWLWARDMAVQSATNLNNMGIHYHPDGDTSKLTGDGMGLTKQFCNRLLEPFMWHTVLITATEWENFFHLRCPQYDLTSFALAEDEKMQFRSRKDATKHLMSRGYLNLGAYDTNPMLWMQLNKGQAEIHMMALAEAMWDAFNQSIPKELKAGSWHVPFGNKIDVDILLGNVAKEVKEYPLFETADELDKTVIKISTAMCARVSYTVVGEEGKPANYVNDIKLHDRLATSGHWSPFEHCARAMSKNESIDKHYYDGTKSIDKYSYGWSGNFRGFVQYRKLFSNENVTK